jgi:hypothetical protein
LSLARPGRDAIFVDENLAFEDNSFGKLLPVDPAANCSPEAGHVHFPLKLDSAAAVLSHQVKLTVLQRSRQFGFERRGCAFKVVQPTLDICCLQLMDSSIPAGPLNPGLSRMIE